MANVQVSVTVGGKAIAQINAEPKTFSSGKVGFWNQARIDIEGKRYMAQVQLVELKAKT